MNNIKTKKALFLLTCIAFIVFIKPSFSIASDVDSESLKDKAITIIETNSQEEYDEVVQAIKEGNKKVNELWSKAITESTKPENQLNNNNPISPMAYTVQTAYLSRGSYPQQHIGFTVTYDRGYSSYYYVNEVYDLTMFSADDSTTTVSQNHAQHRILDGRRTIAANYSGIIGVKHIGGDITYYSKAFYVEYYASGGYYVQD